MGIHSQLTKAISNASADDTWSRTLAEAEVIEEEAHGDLRLLFGESQPGEVVGVYLMDVKVTEDGPVPTHFREDFRTQGPSNYNHGKQADLARTELT